MDEIGVKDAEGEFRRWLEEREAILNMNKNNNKQLNTSSTRERERVSADREFKESP